MPRFNSGFGCRACTGADIFASTDPLPPPAPSGLMVAPEVTSKPAGFVSESPAGTPSPTPVSAPITPLAEPTEADPVTVLPPSKPKDATSFLTTPIGAVASVGAVALGIGLLLSNMGTTTGKRSFA